MKEQTLTTSPSNSPEALLTLQSAAVQAAANAIVITDAQGRISWVNPAFTKDTGYEAHEVIGRNPRMWNSGKQTKAFYRKMWKTILSGNVWRGNMVNRCKDGTLLDEDVTITPIRDHRGTITHFIGVKQNVTELKRAVEALLAAEDQYRSIFENAVEGMFQNYATGGFITVNPAFARILGYDSPEDVLKTIWDITTQIYADPLVREAAGRIQEEQGTLQGFEFEALKKDGTKVWVSLNRRSVWNEKGEHYYEGSIQDITERKRAEQLHMRRATLAGLRADVGAALSRGDASLQKILAKCTEAFVQNLDAAFARIWTLNKEDNVLELQASAGIYTHIDGEHSRIPIGSMKIGLIAKSRQPHITKDVQIDPRISNKSWAKREGIVSFAGYPLMVEDRLLGVVGLFARYRLPDDTLDAIASVTDLIAQSIERKRVEEALALSEVQLRQSQKLEAIGQLAGGVAHDFNNLLTVIGGYSSLLLNRLSAESPHRAGVEQIKKAGDRASGLTRQLLAFSRKQILQPKVLDLNVVTTDLEKMVKRLIGEDIDLVTITDPMLGKVKADPGQIEQVLLNLIVNSRDAMPNGGKITIQTANARLSGDNHRRDIIRAGNYVMLAVSDNGCGMDPETRGRVFEPFFTTKGAGKGTGLGLATVYGIIKQSGGSIWVYSEVGRGTTFKIYLPRVDEPSQTEGLEAGLQLPKGTETILLVEDEEQVRGILQELLEVQGYQLLTATGGEEALRMAAGHKGKIPLMITDVVMPQMSGRELAEKLLPLRPEMKVIYMSGYTDDAIVRHGLLDEKIEFLQKPFDAAIVARKIRQVLDTRSKTE